MATIRLSTVLWPVDVDALTDEQVVHVVAAIEARFGDDDILEDTREFSRMRSDDDTDLAEYDARRFVRVFAESYADAHGEVLEIG